MKKYILPLIILTLLLAGCSQAQPGTVDSNGNNSGKKVTIYKSPTCGCCVQHAAYLKQNGYDVETVVTDDMRAIKDKYNIPYDMESCHTAVFGSYFVEGHVPIGAIEKILSELPAIDGIALPGMPAGSPGMPGVKKEPFEIFALTNGEASFYLEE